MSSKPLPPTFIRYDPSRIDPRELFPLDRIQNDPLEVRIRHEEIKEFPEGPVLQREIIFTSHEFRGEKIRIAAYVALPQGKGPLPVMVQGAGNLDGATGFSRSHNVATIGIDRVGTGDSNGPPDSYNQAWLDLGYDMREGWMVQFVYNTMRAITYMQMQSEVDASRVAVTGGSRGGTMTLIANGVDPRITLAVPTATCGDIITAFEHDGWANKLYSREDAEQGIPPLFRMFSVHGDPINLARTQHGSVMLILGAQDEFFPIYTVKTYYDAVRNDIRLCLVPDWDHGLFSSNRPEVGTYDNREEAGKRTSAAMKHSVDCYLHQKRRMPDTPLLSWLYREGKLEFRCTPDTDWPLEQVDLMYSTDGAYFYKRLTLDKVFENFREYYLGSLEVTSEDLTKLAFFVEAKYEEGPYLMSPPEFGLGFEQNMRHHPPGEPGPEPEFVTEEVEVSLATGTVSAACCFDRTKENRPVLIFLGTPEGDRLNVSPEQLRSEADRFSRQGLFVVAVSASSVDQVAALLDQLVNSHGNFLIEDSVSLVGFSGGGALALECSGRLPDRFKCVVAHSPHGISEFASTARNVHATAIRIFADLEDPSLFVGQSFADEASAVGRNNVIISVSHPTDGLRWQSGWPEDCPVLRRTEDRYMGMITASDGHDLSLPSEGTLLAAPSVLTRDFDLEVNPSYASILFDYSEKDGCVSFRLSAWGGSAPEGGRLVLRGVREATLDGASVEVQDGIAIFDTTASSVISALKME